MIEIIWNLYRYFSLWNKTFLAVLHWKLFSVLFWQNEVKNCRSNFISSKWQFRNSSTSYEDIQTVIFTLICDDVLSNWLTLCYNYFTIILSNWYKNVKKCLRFFRQNERQYLNKVGIFSSNWRICVLCSCNVNKLSRIKHIK